MQTRTLSVPVGNGTMNASYQRVPVRVEKEARLQGEGFWLEKTEREHPRKNPWFSPLRCLGPSLFNGIIIKGNTRIKGRTVDLSSLRHFLLCTPKGPPLTFEILLSSTAIFPVSEYPR